jgi:hypothetical protein
MTTKKYQRRYPESDWDYKAISTIINDNGTKREVIFHTLKTKNKTSQGVEVLTGANYLLGSKDRSNAKTYPITKYPAKYKDVVAMLKGVFAKTKWSSAKYVNEN